MKISKNFIFKPFFLYDWANYRPPNLGFRTLVVIYLKSILAIFQKKNQLDADKTGKCWEQTTEVRISKNFIFKPFFLYDWANYRPSNLDFRNLVVIYFKSILANFQKNHLDANKTGKCWKQTTVVRISKNFIFKPFFLYDGAKNRSPNLNYWTLAVTYFQIILAILSKNQLNASETGIFKALSN